MLINALYSISERDTYVTGDVLDEEWRTSQIIDGEIEKALNLFVV